MQRKIYNKKGKKPMKKRHIKISVK